MLLVQRLQNFVFDILMQHSRGKSALVFCSTRKGAQEASQCISQTAMSMGFSNPFICSKQQQDRLKEASLSCSDKQMQSCIIYGVGYHNGGLCMKDRNLVESLFLNGDLKILCTTNTLAHGINLPAHTVVIKSTQYFNKEKGLYTEYERSMILQMCGRAGRPPFDDTGTVIIMTRKDTVHLYENLLNGCEMVESQLLSCAIEHLNAEIVQLTVTDISLAIEWLKCSYLYVRIKKNPENYGLKRGVPSQYLENHMRGICVQNVKELSEHGMIWIDEDGFLVKPLEPARLMTKFYLKFNTMKLIVKAPGSCSMDDVLHIISQSEEISWIQLRRNEKKLLNDINTDKEGRLRFHVLGEKGKRKKRIQTKEDKIVVLTNDCLTGDPLIHDMSLSQDVNSICTNGCRVARCMKEHFIYRKSYKGTISSALLAKCLHQRLWDDSPYVLKQLPGIGMVTAKALHSAGINSFESMAAADPRKIEIVTARKYPFGNHVKESLSLLPPKVTVKLEEAECKRQGKLKLIVTLTRKEQSVMMTKYHYADILVGSEEDNVILFHEKIRAEEFSSPYAVTVLVSCPQNSRVTLKADLLYEEYVGLDVHEKLVVTKGFSPIKWRTGQAAADSSFPPKEIVDVEDYERTNCEVISDEVQDLVNPNLAESSMPSFNLLPEEVDTDAFAPELGETECKIKNEDMIFNHIREKSKEFPSLLKSKALDKPSEPLFVKSILDDLMMIDSESENTSREMTTTDFPAERKGQICRNDSRSLISFLHTEFINKSTCSTDVQPGCSRPSCNNLLKEIPTVSCKRSLPMETDSVSKIRKDCSKQASVGNFCSPNEVSFLGFKSIFSFL